MQAQNQSGKWYKLIQKPNGNYAVYARSVNYRQGKDIATWGFCVPTPRTTPHNEMERIAREGMPKSVAVDLFNKKIKGKQK